MLELLLSQSLLWRDQFCFPDDREANIPEGH